MTTVAPAGVSFAKVTLTGIVPDTTGFVGYFGDAFIGQGATPVDLLRFSAE